MVTWKVTTIHQWIEAYGKGDSRRRLFFALLLSVACHAAAIAYIGYVSVGALSPGVKGSVVALSVRFSFGDKPASSSSENETGQPEVLVVRGPDTSLEQESQGKANSKGAFGAVESGSAGVRTAPPRYYSAQWLGRRPIPLYAITPKYPSGIEGVSGKVSLLLLINENGGVDNVRVLRSEPPGVFDQESIIAFAKAKYAAGRIGKTSVRSRFVVEIKFDPGEEPKVGEMM